MPNMFELVGLPVFLALEKAHPLVVSEVVVEIGVSRRK